MKYLIVALVLVALLVTPAMAKTKSPAAQQTVVTEQQLIVASTIVGPGLIVPQTGWWGEIKRRYIWTFRVIRAYCGPSENGGTYCGEYYGPN